MRPRDKYEVLERFTTYSLYRVVNETGKIGQGRGKRNICSCPELPYKEEEEEEEEEED